MSGRERVGGFIGATPSMSVCAWIKVKIRHIIKHIIKLNKSK
jgi:hypothetical protein